MVVPVAMKGATGMEIGQRYCVRVDPGKLTSDRVEYNSFFRGELALNYILH